MRRTFFSSVGLIVLVVIGILVYLRRLHHRSDAAGRWCCVSARWWRRSAATSSRSPSRASITSLPLIDNVVYFEKRILDLDSPPLEIIASDQKRLVVDAFGRFKITNALLFYQSVGTVDGARERLGSVLNSAVRGCSAMPPSSRWCATSAPT